MAEQSRKSSKNEVGKEHSRYLKKGKKPTHKEAVAIETEKVSWGPILGGLECKEFKCQEPGAKQNTKLCRSICLGTTQLTKNHVFLRKLIPFLFKHSASM